MTALGGASPGLVRLGRSCPDATSYRRKFALVLPATNTTTGHDLWRFVFRNDGAGRRLLREF